MKRSTQPPLTPIERVFVSVMVSAIVEELKSKTPGGAGLALVAEVDGIGDSDFTPQRQEQSSQSTR